MEYKTFANKYDSVKLDGVKPHLRKDYDWFKNQATIDYDSVEGKTILENWVNKWIGILKETHKKHFTIVCDLSGGMDSRVFLVLLLLSGLKDKTIFYTHKYKGLEGENQKYLRDWVIVQQLKERFGLKLYHESFSSCNFPRLSGICNTFKTRKSFTDGRIENPEAYGPGFKAMLDKWIAAHPDADDFDIRQLSWEICFNQWHDCYKYDRESKTKLILCPYMDLELKKLKNKGYGLWKYFMKTYYPEMLEIEVEGRGLITDEVLH